MGVGRSFLIDSVYRIVIIESTDTGCPSRSPRPVSIIPKPNQRLARGPRLLIYQCHLIKSSFLVPSFLFRSLSRPGAYHPLSLAAAPPARSSHLHFDNLPKQPLTVLDRPICFRSLRSLFLSFYTSLLEHGQSLVHSGASSTSYTACDPLALRWHL